ncbi:MAG: ATP-grasp domain-containing protein [Myxococcales bacterium]|nr:ATP-grasp domain-containing protein [Myxococcales bacterium]
MDAVSPTVGITGMNATDNPAPGVAVARSLRDAAEFGGRLIGLGYDALDPGFYARGLLDAAAILPFPSAGREAVLAKLAEVKARLGLDVLIPTLDSELRALAALAPELERIGIATFSPRADSLEAASKAELPELARRAGFRVPESEALNSVDALPRVVRRLGLPIVIKGVFYGASIAHTEADAVSAFHHFVATWGLPVIAQKYVRGEEYNVAALGDGKGGTVGAVAMRKMALTDKGKGWAGVTIDDPELLRVSESLIGALAWRGGLEVEFLKDSDSGVAYVAEVNPRFPAWVYLATGAGQNLPWANVRLALGAPVSRLGAYRVGTLFVRISLDQIAELSRFGELASVGVADLREKQS